MDKKKILQAYLFAALWTAELDARDLKEITSASKKKAIEDINSFIKKAGTLLEGMEESQIGHDFWLSRNHHGAGFFDRGLGKIGDKLQDLSQEFVELNVFDEGKIIIIE